MFGKINFPQNFEICIAHIPISVAKCPTVISTTDHPLPPVNFYPPIYINTLHNPLIMAVEMHSFNAVE